LSIFVNEDTKASEIFIWLKNKNKVENGKFELFIGKIWKYYSR